VSGMSETSARLVAVVVTYNRLAHLRTCLAALREQRCDAIVVVDNRSTDGTGEWLAAQRAADSRLDVLTMPRNLGGAGGFEAGFRHARARYRPEWLVCFDDDAWPQPGAFRAFLEADLEGIDAAAAAVYFPDGRICEMNRPGLNPFWHPRRFLKTVLGQGRRGFHLDDADYRADAPVDIDSTSFVGFFVRGTMVERVGLPEGRLFIYGDDVLYALNVRRQGGAHRLPAVGALHPRLRHLLHPRKDLRATLESLLHLPQRPACLPHRRRRAVLAVPARQAGPLAA